MCIVSYWVTMPRQSVRFLDKRKILTFWQIIEKLMRNDEIMCLALNWQNTFDNVNWNTVFIILLKIEINYRERIMIYNLYKHGRAVCSDDEEILVSKGMRQSCSCPIMYCNCMSKRQLIRSVRKYKLAYTRWRNDRYLKFTDDIGDHQLVCSVLG